MAVVYSVHIVYTVFFLCFFFIFIIHSFHVFIYNSFCCNVQFPHTGLIKVSSLSSSNNKGLIVNAFIILLQGKLYIYPRQGQCTLNNRSEERLEISQKHYKVKSALDCKTRDKLLISASSFQNFETPR